jgi:hypothetical protein
MAKFVYALFYLLVCLYSSYAQPECACLEEKNPYAMYSFPVEPTLLASVLNNTNIKIDTYDDKAWITYTLEKNWLISPFLPGIQLSWESALRTYVRFGNGTKGSVGLYFGHEPDSVCAIVKASVLAPWTVNCRNISASVSYTRDTAIFQYTYHPGPDSNAKLNATMVKGSPIEEPCLSTGLVGFLTDPTRAKLVSFKENSSLTHIGTYHNFATHNCFVGSVTHWDTDLIATLTKGAISDPHISTFMELGTAMWCQNVCCSILGTETIA